MARRTPGDLKQEGNLPLDGGDTVSALERGFRVLECFAAARRPLGNAEVADLTDIPRPTVTRLISTLVSLGQLRPAPEMDRYELAAGVVRLAQAFLGAIDVRSFARPHLTRLAEDTSASALVGVRDGLEVLVVEASRSRSAVMVMGADVGTRMSLVTSALGRAWLAGLDPDAYAGVREQIRASGRHASALELKAMDRAVRSARETGYALSLGEWHPNMNAVAVPVRTASGEIISINCGSPAFVLPIERLKNFVLPRLLEAAHALARDIGGSAGLALTAQAAQEGIRLPPPAAVPVVARARPTRMPKTALPLKNPRNPEPFPT
ncbi:MAG: IclR family transcriptional regulator [Burkholderiaceae bacterium]